MRSRCSIRHAVVTRAGNRYQGRERQTEVDRLAGELDDPDVDELADLIRQASTLR